MVTPEYYFYRFFKTVRMGKAAETYFYGFLFLSSFSGKAMVENVKKCKNFLSTLIRLSHSQPAEVVKNVRALIQGLIVSVMFVFSKV